MSKHFEVGAEYEWHYEDHPQYSLRVTRIDDSRVYATGWEFSSLETLVAFDNDPYYEEWMVRVRDDPKDFEFDV